MSRKSTQPFHVNRTLSHKDERKKGVENQKCNKFYEKTVTLIWLEWMSECVFEKECGYDYKASTLMMIIVMISLNHNFVIVSRKILSSIH